MSMYIRVRPGDQISWFLGGSFNHGCTDSLAEEVFLSPSFWSEDGEEILNPVAIAIVVGVTSCSSCWQVGHDRDHSAGTVGGYRILPMAGEAAIQKIADEDITVHAEDRSYAI